jgi:hypothetical protein
MLLLGCGTINNIIYNIFLHFRVICFISLSIMTSCTERLYPVLSLRISSSNQTPPSGGGGQERGGGEASRPCIPPRRTLASDTRNAPSSSATRPRQATSACRARPVSPAHLGPAILLPCPFYPSLSVRVTSSESLHPSP